MILNDKVSVKVKGNNKLEYYNSLGYNTSSDFLVNISDLTPMSNILIKAKCDFCGNIKEISYFNYNRNKKRGDKFSCSKKCSLNKTKKTNTDKYGGVSPMSSDIVKEKAKNTNLERFGVEYAFNCKEIKSKIEKTNLKRYKSKNPFGSNMIKEKIRKTNLERYESENPFGSDIIKEKIKKTNILNYGVEYFTKSSYFLINSEDLKEKIKKTNLLKYGDTSASRNEYYRKSNTKIANNPNYIKYIGNKVSLFNYDLNKNHKFEINSDNYISRLSNNIPLCTICNPIGSSQSIKENSLYDFIRSIYDGKIVRSYRDGLEIDIFLPNLKLGFEFNGLHYHSEKFKGKKYHLNKTIHFKERNIRIIHIWEDDWDFKKNIVISQIKNWLGLVDNKVFARKCQVREIKNPLVSKDFLNTNHLQGSVVSSLKLGLYYKDELVSLMTFDHNNGRNTQSKDFWNLNRFCSLINFNIIGGFSKLLSYFLKNYHVNKLITYSDFDWSSGDIYLENNFRLVSRSKPDYKYIVKGKRVHKSRYRKEKLGIKGSSITESEYVKNLGLNRIYDCGKIKFEKI